MSSGCALISIYLSSNIFLERYPPSAALHVVVTHVVTRITRITRTRINRITRITNKGRGTVAAASFGSANGYRIARTAKTRASGALYCVGQR